MAVELDDIGLNGGACDLARENRRLRYRQIRIERNQTRKQIASDLSIDRGTWTTWERHGDEPSELSLSRLHAMTGYDYAWLRGE
jgi:transcriptional regulator with XRE-family HTH domain